MEISSKSQCYMYWLDSQLVLIIASLHSIYSTNWETLCLVKIKIYVQKQYMVIDDYILSKCFIKQYSILETYLLNFKNIVIQVIQILFYHVHYHLHLPFFIHTLAVCGHNMYGISDDQFQIKEQIATGAQCSRHILPSL